MTPLEWLFALFVVLSVADGITTYRALKRPKTREANRVMRWLLDRFGIHQTLICSKLAAAASVWYTMSAEYWWIVAAINACYTAVVMHNVSVMRQRAA